MLYQSKILKFYMAILVVTNNGDLCVSIWDGGSG